MLIGILYNIRSVYNVGSIFRSADGAGINALYLCGITPTPLDRFGNKRSDFIKTSLGAEDSITWKHFPSQEDILSMLQELSQKGFSLISIEQTSTSIPLYSYTPEKNVAFIVGNEVEGIPEFLYSQTGTHLHIPMRGQKESLNVSVAFGIASYYLSGEK